ncbi:4'-phosphopantetheinyl transferase family protein [Candidatus Paracaedibacter symbiosus]|uniref:4'-phosphopantetheinyl transferase family protein n=1 Tax=Candidatus Paracaedibacter symbiosus TaxID=244582 RepID=UPI000509E8FB|nr:4'-phosphopantetheinyl transferase superfamily protein [Candidatus Paracaedibacter symbiosus]
MINSENVINVISINLDKFEKYISTFSSYLSSEEKERADKFVFAHLKKRYIISHGFLRILIGKYLSLPPSEVDYAYNEFLKPLSKQNADLYFSMSHSHNVACYAFSFHHNIGIDIEYKNNDLEVKDLGPAIMTHNESLVFEKLNKIDKLQLFYKTWTIKEAFLKALGVGLSYPLSRIETTILPKDEFKVVKLYDIKEELEEWSFFSITSLPCYLGAVAIRKKETKINFINIRPSPEILLHLLKR